jgi:predicted SAM-dependent methyltransferase
MSSYQFGKMSSKRNVTKVSVVVALGLILGVGGAYGYGQIGLHWLIAKSYLQTHSIRKLQIGAGDNQLVGWLNTDIEPQAGEAYLDATRPFPLPDGSISYIFSEHVIEHLSYDDGLKMLAECYRTLKPGGKIRIATPNLLSYVGLFSASKTDTMKSYVSDRMAFGDAQGHPWLRTISPEAMILNMEMRSYGHRFIYDPATLEDSLVRARFVSVTQFRPGESDDPQLSNIEMRHRSPIRRMNDFESMVLQATKG